MNHNDDPTHTILVFGLYLLIIVGIAALAVSVKETSDDHKAQLNRVIELLEKKP